MLQATEFEATWGVVGDRPISCVRLWSSYDVNIEDGTIVAGASKAAFLRKGQGASVGSWRPKIRPQPYGPASPRPTHPRQPKPDTHPTNHPAPNSCQMASNSPPTKSVLKHHM